MESISANKGLEVTKHFSGDTHPFNDVTWEKRTARITGSDGKTVFEQVDVEFPSDWSMTATNVVAQKYFRGKLGTLERESSVQQLIGRVVDTITTWGTKGGYFESETSADNFHNELAYILVHQMAAFNSPVWFNVGFEKKPQTSACFINSVQDTMESILELAKTEGMLFKHGSGTGSNLSTLRSSKERLSVGGEASGPISFMKGYDSFAGVIKSGGRTRRAAKMVILNADHPDIVEFIQCKEREEKKAWALIDAGYDGSFNGEAYASVQFQNANNSVRVTDEFMDKVLSPNDKWATKEITTGRVSEVLHAKELLKMIADAAHLCGDPGMQFDTTINKWHTCPNSGRINASNPCSEYMFLDDSACNLASLNLMKFRNADGSFDTAAFSHAVRILIIAQEILVSFSSYPTPAIERNSIDYRPLGLGYANLGALLMANGYAYDSDAGRDYAAGVTSLMCGAAYRASAELAAAMGPFNGYAKNSEAMLNVVKMHTDAACKLPTSLGNLYAAAVLSWALAQDLGREHGYRNSQVTVLAPTGTIGFMMDCDTTGVEPDIALVKYKSLVGGGMLKLVNGTVEAALVKLGYSASQIKEIIDYISANDTIEGAPQLSESHLDVFDCAFKPSNGTRSIHWMGHLRMVAAVQPFISGAISKTINCPNNATAEDIYTAYIDAWKMGIKAVAFYRDGSKRIQPLNTSREVKKESLVHLPASSSLRQRLPDERSSITHKFSVGGHEGYLTAGMYEDGRPGEIFIVMSKEGSVVSGLMNTVAEATSIALQYGVPLQVLVNKFSHTRFEPSGWTSNPSIPVAKSVIDYVFRWLELKFTAKKECIPCRPQGPTKPFNMVTDAEQAVFLAQSDAPPCHTCGSITVRSGTCYKCMNCGSTSGCS